MAEPKTPAVPKEIQALSFEKAMAELDNIVGRLEKGDVGLEESIEIYTRGTQLKTHCEAKLQTARAQVERLVVGADGNVAGTRPMDSE
ncbi:MAG: exodeoxyribonuclease VII small subunit [Alphaproteobacteria bacterium]